MSTSHNIVIYIEQQFLFGIFFSFSTSKNGSNQSKQRSRYCGKCQCFVRCRLRLSRTNNRHLSWAWYKSVIVLLIINITAIPRDTLPLDMLTPQIRHYELRQKNSRYANFSDLSTPSYAIF